MVKPRWFDDGLRSYSSWALGVTNMDVLVVLSPLLFGLWWCFSLSRLSDFACLLFRAWSSWCSSSLPGEGAASFLVVLFLLVVSTALLRGCSCSLWRRLASLRSAPRTSLVLSLAVFAFLVDFLSVLVDKPFLWNFRVAGVPARWRGLMHVFFGRLAPCVFRFDPSHSSSCFLALSLAPEVAREWAPEWCWPSVHSFFLQLSSRISSMALSSISWYCVFYPFFAAFSELRSVHQVERFAVCSFRHLPPVIFHLAGHLWSFYCSQQLQIQEAAKWRGLHRLR